MRPARRIALLGCAILGLGLASAAPARADHQLGHDHPFCAQGGSNISAGGEGGTIFTEADAVLHGGGAAPEVPRSVLVPAHLAERFGEDDPNVEIVNGFVEIPTRAIEDAGVGSSGSAFHGGHGGGPGGGQGGSTFFGAGDGGCSPLPRQVTQRPPPGRPGQRLPVTGSVTEQLGLMAGLFISLGTMMWMVGRRRSLLAAAPMVGPQAVRVPPVRRGHEVISRLKDQVKGAW